jgi:L-lactate dehydrogenase complex protein LldG
VTHPSLLPNLFVKYGKNSKETLMSSREQILSRLRQAKRPFPDVTQPGIHLPMVPRPDTSSAGLQDQFIAEAQKAAAVVHQVDSSNAAIETLLSLIGEHDMVCSWSLDQLPLPGLAQVLDEAHISLVEQDANARVGLTGVDAALAATGSIVVSTGNGRYRAASLLPPLHIALLKRSQILPDMESWFAIQKANGLDQLRHSSNLVIITGPSRTADIAMQLVMGMHGPKELHIVLLP